MQTKFEMNELEGDLERCVKIYSERSEHLYISAGGSTDTHQTYAPLTREEALTLASALKTAATGLNDDEGETPWSASIP